MKNKIEEWLEKRSQDIKEEWKDITKAQISECESPIEELFLIEWEYRIALYDDYENFYISPQYSLNNYRVDFIAFYGKDGYHYKEKSLIVEIDSHLWHGSKPDQFTKEKKRERELRKEGYNIMRFSGREVYRNVEKCVEEVLEYLIKIETEILEEEIKKYEMNNPL